MNLLDRFRIKAKLGLIVVISAVALLVALAFAAQTQRQRMIADRIDKIHAIVESACGLAGSLESEVVAGKITREEAMARFHDALHGMWYDGHQDYIGMVTTDGLVRVHPKPGVEGTRGSLRETFKMLRASLPATIELNEAIDDLPRVLADPTQLHQIVVNLVVNAAQAIGDEMGTITIKLAAAPLGALGTAAPCVHLSVSDTGCGMDEATQQRIFEPFFTTKGVGAGTGLGLSVAHGIVTGHGGRITVTSAPGAGTRFDVLLPAMADDEASSTPTLSAAAG